MDAKTFKHALDTLGMTHAEFCGVFGVSLRTVTNYASEGVKATKPLAILLKLLSHRRVTLADIRNARTWRE